MPYSHTEKIIPRHLDRRVKITPEKRELLFSMHKKGVSLRGIARELGVSHGLISFILYPERAERNKELYKRRRIDGRYYNKEKHTIATRKHRRYKQSIKDKLLIRSRSFS